MDFFDQFSFYVGLADLQMVLADFWTQNVKLLLQLCTRILKFLVFL